MDFGPAAADIESAAIYRQAVLNARKTILLVDHSKFEMPSLYKIVDWDRISAVVTDKAPDEVWSESFRSRGIEVICDAKSQQGPIENTTHVD